MLDTDTWIWFLIVPFVGASMGLLFLPKKGPQYAYRNWGRLQVLIICTVAFAGLVSLIFSLAYLLPEDTPEEVVVVAFTTFGLLSMAGVYVYGQRMGPTVGRKSWLRKRYPRVAEAIKRYKQDGDVIEPYYPVLRIDGQCYFLPFYHDSRDLDRLNGALLLDESGRPVGDPELLLWAAKCKHLAVETILYQRHQVRAKGMEDSQGAAGGLLRAFKRLGDAEEWFASQGEEALRDWGAVMQVRDAALAGMESGYWTKYQEAKWAAEHKLGHLTEVNYDDLLELQKAMTEARLAGIASLGRMRAALGPMRRVAELVDRKRGIKGWRIIREGLMGLVEGTESLADQDETYEYATLSEQYRQAWQERTAWALKQGARGSEAAA